MNGLLVALGIGSVMALNAQSPPIHVFVNQKEVVFPDQGPIEVKGRVFVPLRGVFQHLGALVYYDEVAKVVHVKKGEKEIEVFINRDYALNNKSVTINGANAIIVKGRAMVPLRFLAENLDAQVDWVGDTRAVHIATSVSLDKTTTTGGGGG